MTTTTPARSAIDPPVAVRRWAPPVGAVVVAIGLWWLTTTVVSAPHSLMRQAAPQRVAPAVVDLFSRGVLLPDIGISLWRLVIGLAVAVVVGIPAGLLLGLSGTAERAAAPLVQFVRMISPLSWAPIAVAVFGIGNEPVIFLIAVAAVWPVLINTVAGVRAVDPGFLDVARSFHATRWELVTAVVPFVRIAAPHRGQSMRAHRAVWVGSVLVRPIHAVSLQRSGPRPGRITVSLPQIPVPVPLP